MGTPMEWRHTRRRPRTAQGWLLPSESNAPGELVVGVQACPLRPDQLDAPLHRDTSFRAHRIHHHSRSRLGHDVAQLHTVDVEVERTIVVHGVHDGYDMRPASRANRRDPSDPLRSQDLELWLTEHESHPRLNDSHGKN